MVQGGHGAKSMQCKVNMAQGGCGTRWTWCKAICSSYIWAQEFSKFRTEILSISLSFTAIVLPLLPVLISSLGFTHTHTQNV